MLDLIIENTQYPDFKKHKMVFGDLGIRKGKITNLAKDLTRSSAKKRIDGTGRVVAPGFIDIHMHEENFREEGARYSIAHQMLLQGVTTAVGGQCGIQSQPLEEFKHTIKALGGSPINYMMFAGYNHFREQTQTDHYQSVSPGNHQKILKKLEEELHQGASGISFGIEYDPGISTEEIIKTLNHFESNNLIAAAHYRADGDQAPDSIKEMIKIQEKTKKPFQISHLSSCSAMGKMKESLQLINRAMDQGKDISYDTYPYAAFCTTIGSEVFAPGCLEKWGKDYRDILLTEKPYKNVYCTEGVFKTCRKKYPEMLAVAFVMEEDEITQAIANPYGMVASDGILSHGHGHPRASGTFPRILGHYVREKKALSFIDALKKMTFFPAQRLGLFSKGEIQLGYDADLTIFNPETILDRATFIQSKASPLGITQVIINGKIALENQKIVHPRLGKFISKIQ